MESTCAELPATIAANTVGVGSIEGQVIIRFEHPAPCVVMPANVAMELGVALMKHARRAGYAPHAVS